MLANLLIMKRAFTHYAMYHVIKMFNNKKYVRCIITDKTTNEKNNRFLVNAHMNKAKEKAQK